MALVYGVGIYEPGKHRASVNGLPTKYYKMWSSMLHRCYSPLYLEIKPTYGRVTVEGDFVHFQSFGDWMDINYVAGWSLDKDILFPGNTVYQGDRCCMVPMVINTQLNHNRVCRGEHPTGVTLCKRSGEYLAKISKQQRTVNIGRFKSADLARSAYLSAKRAYLDELAAMYRGSLRPDVYQALLRFPIEEDFHGLA